MLDNITWTSLFISALVLIGVYCLFKIILYIIFSIIKLKVERVLHIHDDETKEHIEIPLETCPFCGRNVVNILESKDEDGSVLYSMVCDINSGGCGCSTGLYEKPIDAIHAWNTRSETYDE